MVARCLLGVAMVLLGGCYGVAMGLLDVAMGLLRGCRCCWVVSTT